MRNINRFGEVYYDKNEAIITMPFSRLSLEETGLLEENYTNKIKEIEYPDTFVYADHFSSIRDRLQMSFDLDGCVDFHQIRKYKLQDMLPFLYSMVELGRQDVNILWQKQNMVIDLTEQRVKALLFKFEGFNLYKQDENVDGLKELILLALTNKDSIIAKPKRADFIEKTNDVYQFSDDIIASNSVDEIEGVIKAYHRELEYEEMKREQALAEKKEKSKLFAIKEKIKPKKKEKSPDEKMKEELQAENEQQGEEEVDSKTFLDKITSPVSMVSIIGVLVIFGFFFTTGGFETGASEEDKVSQELDKKEKILESYRLYITGDQENQDKAFAKLDAIGYDNLPEEDQSTLIDWYIQQGQYTKAINVNPDSDIKVADAILNKYEGNAEALKSEMETVSASFPERDIFKYEIGRLDGNHQAIIENSQLRTYNEERAKSTVRSYVLTNQVEALDKLIDKYNDKEDSREALQSQYDRYLDKYREQRKTKEELEKLQSNLEDKKNKLSNTDDEDKEKDLKNDIESLEKEIDKKKEEITKIKEDVRGDDENKE